MQLSFSASPAAGTCDWQEARLDIPPWIVADVVVDAVPARTLPADVLAAVASREQVDAGKPSTALADLVDSLDQSVVLGTPIPPTHDHLQPNTVAARGRQR